MGLIAMRFRFLLAVLAAFPALCSAQPMAAGDSCACKEVRTLDFRGTSSRDRITVFISDGPCASAMLTLEIKTGDGRRLHRFQNSIAEMLLPSLQEDSLPEQARSMAKDIAQTRMTDTAHQLPLEAFKSGPDAEFNSLHVSDRVYRQHLRGRQRVFIHPTFHEGGIAIVYDRKAGKAKVLYGWGS